VRGPAVREQLAGQVGGAAGGFDDLTDVLLLARPERRRPLQELGVARDRKQEVVEIVLRPAIAEAAALPVVSASFLAGKGEYSAFSQPFACGKLVQKAQEQRKRYVMFATKVVRRDTFCSQIATKGTCGRNLWVTRGLVRFLTAQ
jgi:hypothetical protein